MNTETVLVAGASRGLGAATARILAQLGANTVLMSRSADDLAEVTQEINASGGQALAVTGDVSRPADCQRAVAEAIKEFGQLDVLVSNAGILAPIASIADGNPGEWERNWAINVLGPLALTQAALPHLRRRDGRVINVSSGAAVSAIPGWAAFCASKAAVEHLTRVLAEEEPSITAIAFRPGLVDTEMQATIRRDGADGMPEEVYARFVRLFEEGQLLPPEVPGCALAVLSLFCPHEWSGSFLSWNAEDVQSLVRRYGCSPAPSSPEASAA
jgi:NAD(P)-dependent dehydrogenase (short-subunit alcohol dehydrogenase family)